MPLNIVNKDIICNIPNIANTFIMDEPNETISVSLPKALTDMIREAAEKKRQPISWFIGDILLKELAQKKKLKDHQ